MKKTLLIALLLSLGFSQQIIHTETYENGNIKSITYHKKSRTGIEKIKYEEYYENGQINSKETYKDGKLDGLWTEWYENGKKQAEGTYKDGKEDGLWPYWYEDGQKRREETYKDGEDDGKWVDWYENGQKRVERNFKDGKEDGLKTYWYENGQKRQEVTLKNGNRDGLSTEWYENGQKKKEGEYLNGERIKGWVYYLEDGLEIKTVCISTEFGIMILELYPDVAPNHVESFIQHVKHGYYNGTTFHRVIPGFVIQGGDPNSKDNDRMNDGTGGRAGKYFGIGREDDPDSWLVPAEFNERPHITGALSMARAQENNSAGSQFFICAAPAHQLDNKYTVFGQVISGFEVIDQIANANTPRRENKMYRGPDGDNPNNKIEMEIDFCEK